MLRTVSLRRFIPTLPRSLGGRTTLILLVPVIGLMIAMSIVVVQRLYDGVSSQMTREASRQMRVVLAAEDPAAMAEAMDIGFRMGDAPVGTSRRWFDVSGQSVIATFADALPGLTGVDLTPPDKRVRVGVETARGPVTLVIDRGRLTPRNPHQLLVVLAVTAALMTLIAGLYLRGQVRPIIRLAAAAEAFGKGRVLPYRPTGATEVRMAGSAFLSMRERIERQLDERTRFLSGVSHDLRTPLTRLKLALGMMDDDDAETRQMRRDVEEMERMLDAFLDFARGDMQAETVRAAPRALAEESVRRAVRSGAVAVLRDGPEIAELEIAPDMIARALDNLIGNAARYAGRAEVSILEDAAWVVFRVEDDGPGIPPERRADAIKPFLRLDAARNQDAGAGTGLGLAIAADAAARHGGRLVLDESPRLGGLMAELRLPR